MQILPVLPIIVPMLAAAVTLPMPSRPRVQAGIGLFALSVVLVSALMVLAEVAGWGGGGGGGGFVKVEMNGWPAPFGIALVIDTLSGVLLLMTAVVAMVTMSFAAASIVDQPGRDAQVPLMLMLTAAVSGAFMTGDLFNLYVWYELMLLSSFVLLTVGGTGRQFQAAVKYVALNLLSSTVFVAAAGLIYGVTGALNMAHLSLRFDALGDASLSTALAAPLLVGFSIKCAAFPFFFWLPASYHTPRPAVSALFAGLLTTVGAYSIIRACTLIFDQEWGVLGGAVLVIACLTMLVGIMGAVSQPDLRRLLSFHAVGHVGYMLMGLGVAMTSMAAAQSARAGGDVAAAESLERAAALGMAGSVFYIIHDVAAKTNLFLIAGAILRVRGTSEMSKLGGMMRTHPWLAGVYLVSSMALAGIPILSGFWAKLALVRAGIEGGHGLVVTVALAVSVLTLYNMTRVWSEVFWGPTPEGQEKPRRAGLGVLAPVTVMAAITVGLGLFAGPVWSLSRAAAGQLLDSEAYIAAVLPAELIEAERRGRVGGEATAEVTAMFGPQDWGHGGGHGGDAPVATVPVDGGDH